MGLIFFKCSYGAYSMLVKILLYAVYKNSPSVQTLQKQIMSVLLILCYNGTFVTWTVASLTAAKFKLRLFLCCQHTYSHDIVWLLLSKPAYNVSTRSLQKTAFLCCYWIVAENINPLWFEIRCLATAGVQWAISRSPLRIGSTGSNIIKWSLLRMKR
jgi:hypothetical protein